MQKKGTDLDQAVLALGDSLAGFLGEQQAAAPLQPTGEDEALRQIGRRCRDARRLAGLSLDDAAGLMELDAEALQQLERGVVADTEQLRRYAAVLGIGAWLATWAAEHRGLAEQLDLP